MFFVSPDHYLNDNQTNCCFGHFAHWLQIVDILETRSIQRKKKICILQQYLVQTTTRVTSLDTAHLHFKSNCTICLSFLFKKTFSKKKTLNRPSYFSATFTRHSLTWALVWRNTTGPQGRRGFKTNQQCVHTALSISTTCTCGWKRRLVYSVVKAAFCLPPSTCNSYISKRCDGGGEHRCPIKLFLFFMYLFIVLGSG